MPLKVYEGDTLQDGIAKIRHVLENALHLPEVQSINESHLLMGEILLARGYKVIAYDDGVNTGFSIFLDDCIDFHITGIGLTMYVTVSLSEVASSKIFKALVRRAKNLKLNWVAISRREAPYVYRNTYHRI